jgi:hypothetical protein
MNRMQVIQNHGSGHYGASQRAATGLIHTRHQAGDIPSQSGLLNGKGFFGSHGQQVEGCHAIKFGVTA